MIPRNACPFGEDQMSQEMWILDLASLKMVLTIDCTLLNLYMDQAHIVFPDFGRSLSAWGWHEDIKFRNDSCSTMENGYWSWRIHSMRWEVKRSVSNGWLTRNAGRKWSFISVFKLGNSEKSVGIELKMKSHFWSVIFIRQSGPYRTKYSGIRVLQTR